jgi:hypothetical protein
MRIGYINSTFCDVFRSVQQHISAQYDCEYLDERGLHGLLGSIISQIAIPVQKIYH